jgi:hypothetical protein
VAQFEYLGIAFGLLYTAAALRLISGVPYALRPGRRDVLHAGFLAGTLVGIAVNFWKFGALTSVDWTIPRFLLALSLPAAVYVVSVTLVPEDAYRVESWREHFMTMRRPFFLSFVLVGVIVAGHRVLLLGQPPELAPLALPAVGIAGSLSTDRRFLTLLMVVSNAFILLAVVRPAPNPWG